MPSLRRSRNDRCRLGPEPIGGNDVLPPRFMLLWIDNVVGLPDKFRLPDEFESVDVAIGADDRIICLFCWAPDELLTNGRCFGDEQSREGDAITNHQWFSSIYKFCQRFYFRLSFVWIVWIWLVMCSWIYEILCCYVNITNASIITSVQLVYVKNNNEKKSLLSAHVYRMLLHQINKFIEFMFPSQCQCEKKRRLRFLS